MHIRIVKGSCQINVLGQSAIVGCLAALDGEADLYAGEAMQIGRAFDTNLPRYHFFPVSIVDTTRLTNCYLVSQLKRNPSSQLLTPILRKLH